LCATRDSAAKALIRSTAFFLLALLRRSSDPVMGHGLPSALIDLGENNVLFH